MQQVLEFAPPIEFPPQPCGRGNSLLSAAIPEPPSMPSALLRMELLLKGPVADLGGICDVIRNDIGLSVGILRMSSNEEDLPIRLQDLVLSLGTDTLRSWVRERSLLGPACPTSRSAMAELTRHARLVARAAEVIARFMDTADKEEAYFGGLLHDIGALPEMLGWYDLPEFGTERIQTGLMLARSWELPGFILDAMQPERVLRPLTPLGQIVSAALQWTNGVEQALHAGVDCHRRISWSHSIVEHWLPTITPARSERMFASLDSSFEIWLAHR